MIDTHCHLNLEQYDEDRDDVIQHARASGVNQIIIPGIDLVTSQEGINYSTRYDEIFVAVGVHPNSTSDFNQTTLNEIETLTQQKKVVAIGEIGLDYYWDKSPKAQQIEALKAQLELAARLEYPVIIHNRESSEDVIQILEDWVTSLPDSLRDRPGVLHSFSAPQEIADRALAIGFYLGFTGPITFKKADDLRSIASTVPLDRILVETDGPYLTPHPYRGKRNEPAYIPYIVERLAAIKNVSTEEMAIITTENAERLFRLSKARYA